MTRPRFGTFRAAFIAFFVTSGESSYAKRPVRSARPCFSSRSRTTGHRLQRGRDVQQRFFVFTGIRAA